MTTENEKSGVHRSTITNSLFDTKVAVPCVVDGFIQNGTDEPFVNVRTSIKKHKYIEGRQVEFTETVTIEEVPIAYISSQKFAITIPVEKGDRGWLIHCDYDLDAWNVDGEEVAQPDNIRSHDLNDCVFFPALWPRPKGIGKYSNENLVLRTLDNTSSVSISPDGIIRLSAAQLLELNAPLITFNGTPLVTMNPGPPASFVTVAPGTPDAPEDVRRP